MNLPPLVAPPGKCFIALDFETADQGRDSACALGMAKVIDNEVVDQYYYLIRPPRKTFLFTNIHGLTWNHVQKEPSFAELWPTLKDILAEANYLVAHNASFDRGVLHTCCEQLAGVEPPSHQFFCSIPLARRTWNLYAAGLANVCRHLGLSLNHHNAQSDALACAKIVIAARQHFGKPELPWKPLALKRK